MPDLARYLGVLASLVFLTLVGVAIWFGVTYKGRIAARIREFDETLNNAKALEQRANCILCQFCASDNAFLKSIIQQTPGLCTAGPNGCIDTTKCVGCLSPEARAAGGCGNCPPITNPPAVSGIRR